MAGTVEELVNQGRALLRAGDAAGARRILEQALAKSPCGDVVDSLARAAYLEIDCLGAIEQWEQAYALYREAGDQVGAVRVARTLGYMYATVVGDWAVSRGWTARAQTLLRAAAESPEAGWVSLNLGMFEEDRARREECFRAALEAARRSGDSDLEFAAAAYLGASLVHDNRFDEGMLLLDEALAAVAGQEVDDFAVVEEIFCQLFSACEHAHDVARADQWIRVGDAIARRRNLPSVSAFCRTHYGAILTAAGRWAEADAALTESVRLWGLGERSGLRTGALVRLADSGCARDASRRPNSSLPVSTAPPRPPAPGPRSTSPAARRPAGVRSWSGPWRKSTRPAPPPRPSSPSWSTRTSPPESSRTPRRPRNSWPPARHATPAATCGRSRRWPRPGSA